MLGWSPHSLRGVIAIAGNAVNRWRVRKTVPEWPRAIGATWMHLRTRIARLLFPHDQTFMARRKLRYVVLAVLVGLLAAGAVFGMMMLAQANH